MDKRARPRRRSFAQGQPDVGQAQDRRAAAPRGLRLLGFDGGRILAYLVKRGAVVAVPVLRRRPTAKRICLTAKERYARRLPKGRKAKTPGELVQIDTLFVNIRPNKAIKHFTTYDSIAKWTIGRVCTKASAASGKSLLDKLLIEAPFAIRGIQVDGALPLRRGRTYRSRSARLPCSIPEKSWRNRGRHVKVPP